jgi:uncharacterized protein (TIGR03382 family)
MRVCLGFGIVMLAASTADAGAICTLSSSYNDPGLGGTCFVDAIEGCPVHFVRPHQAPPVDEAPIVYRDGQVVNVTSTTAVVGSTTQQLDNIDYLSCDCQRTSETIQFDEIELTITGARAGDEVDIGGSEITIAPAGACTPPVWPTEFDVQLGGCDPCPIDPIDEPGSGCGCGTTSNSAFVPGLLAIALGWRLRRRR